MFGRRHISKLNKGVCNGLEEEESLVRYKCKAFSLSQTFLVCICKVNFTFYTVGSYTFWCTCRCVYPFSSFSQCTSCPPSSERSSFLCSKGISASVCFPSQSTWKWRQSQNYNGIHLQSLLNGRRCWIQMTLNSKWVVCAACLGNSLGRGWSTGSTAGSELHWLHWLAIAFLQEVRLLVHLTDIAKSTWRGGAPHTVTSSCRWKQGHHKRGPAQLFIRPVAAVPLGSQGP